MHEKVKSFYLENMPKIGRENIIIEIDESKFGKRKHHCGHQVEGVWVLGLVEKTSSRKIVFIPVEKRDSNTFKNIIEKIVVKKSIIRTDRWRVYNNLSDEHIHQVVNHSRHF